MYNSCMLPAMAYGADTRTLTNQAQGKLAVAQIKMERSMLNDTDMDRRTNVSVKERKSLEHNQQRERKLNGPGQATFTASKPPMDLACYHLETNCWTRSGRGQRKQANLEATCWEIRPNTGHCDLPNDDDG